MTKNPSQQAPATIKTLSDIAKDTNVHISTVSRIVNNKYFLYNAMESLVEQIKFDTPDEFLKKWMILNNKEVSKENIDEILKILNIAKKLERISDSAKTIASYLLFAKEGLEL